MYTVSTKHIISAILRGTRCNRTNIAHGYSRTNFAPTSNILCNIAYQDGTSVAGLSMLPVVMQFETCVDPKQPCEDVMKIPMARPNSN